MMTPDEKIAGSKIYMQLHEAGCKDAYVKAMELLMMDKIVDLLKILCDNSVKIRQILEEAHDTGE